MKRATVSFIAAAILAGCGGQQGDKAMKVVTSGSADTIQFAVGWSGANASAKAAATEALQAALGAIDGRAKAVVFYTYFQDPDFQPDESSQASACKADIQAEDLVAGTINDLCGGIPNLGCRARPLTNGGTLLKNAVAVLAIGGRQASVATAKVPIQDDRLATGKAVAAAMKGVKDLKLILALAEMRLSFEAKQGVSVEDFIRGALDGAPKGAVLFGGNSMPDDMASAGGLAGKQFYNGQAMKGHVVALGLGGPFSAFGNHANEFSPSARTAAVTATKDKWVVTLGGKDKDGKAVDVPDGSLMFVAPIADGTKVFCLACQKAPEPIVASAKAAIGESVAAAAKAGQAPALCLLSDCCARGMRLRTFTKKGNDEIRQAVLPALGSGVPIFGFYAWGELGRIQGQYQGMNHQYQQHTFVSTLLAVE